MKNINRCERCDKKSPTLHYNNFLDMILCFDCCEIEMREAAERADLDMDDE